MSSDGLRKLDVLDAMRGIAILLVFSYHVRLAPVPIVETGHYGVELFFFLSGFCLFYPYARARFDGLALPTLMHFAYQRAIKIVPSYFIAILGALSLRYDPAVFSSTQEAARQIGLHVLFLHTFFNDSFRSINAAFWSLGIEAQFYVIFPLLAWCMIREPLLTTFYILLFSVFARFYGISHPWMEWWMTAHSLPLEIDLFVTGMFTAYAFRALATQYEELTHPRLAWAWTLLALSGVALYCVSCAYVQGYHGSNLQAERQTLLSLDVSFASVTLGSLFGLPAWKAIFANPIVKFYAIISYNLYLWHAPLFPFIDKLHAWSFLTYIPAPYASLLFCLISLLCCSAVAAVCTYGIERPLMRLRLHAPAQPAPHA